MLIINLFSSYYWRKEPGKQFRLWSCIVFLLLTGLDSVYAQRTTVFGVVKDSTTGEALSFASVYFQGTQVGLLTDEKGSFNISAPESLSVDTLVCSYFGYIPRKIPIIKGKDQQLDIELVSSNYQLDEVVIVPPAYPIIRKAINRKEQNDRSKHDFYEMEAYTKIELGLDDLDEKQRDKGWMRTFGKVIDEYLDTTSDKLYLPFFITETISDIYYRKRTNSKREYIKASKVAGTKNQSFSRLLGDANVSINIYDDNIILLLNKSVVSPISDAGFRFYDYDLIDSMKIGDHWSYQIKFWPRRKQSPTFEGDIWIEQSNYAVKKVEMTLADDINVNYISHFYVQQHYDEFGDDNWMPSKDSVYMEAEVPVPPFMRVYNFVAKRTSTYEDVKFGIKKPDEIYTSSRVVNISEDALEKGDAYWLENRHEELSANEKKAYSVVDRARQLPMFKFLRTMVRGYADLDKLEIGPLYTFYSFNQIEGHRIKFGARTRKLLGEKTSLASYVAYGFRDEQIKYGTSITRILSQNPRRVLTASYANDLELIGSTVISSDNVINAVAGNVAGTQISGYEQVSLGYEREWFEGFSNTLSVTRRELTPRGEEYDFRRTNGNGEVSNELVSTEVSLFTHFGWKERFLVEEDQFDRISLGSTHPIIDAKYTLGLEGVLGSNVEFHKLVLGLSHQVQLGTLGYMDYRVEGGKVWGEVPFPYLFIPPGNETFYFFTTTFNAMDFFEFVTDQYVSASVSYHMEGLLFNRIPLLRKLKLREVFTIRGVAGSLNDANQNLEIEIPDVTNPLNRPYLEASVGIKNFLSLFRFDALWRLTHRDFPNARGFGVRMRIDVSF